MYPLTPQQVVPSATIPLGSVTINVDEIQGDVLVGMQKKFEMFVFFAIPDPSKFKSILGKHVVGEITTTRTVIEREHLLAVRKEEGKSDLLPLVGLNVGFTQAGIDEMLGTPTPLGDSSFQIGAAARAKSNQSIPDPTGGPPTGPMNDPVDAMGTLTTWLPDFLSAIHGVFLITGGTAEAVEHEFSHLLSMFGGSWNVVHTDLGSVRPGAAAGHEHFGWQDGVSQPAVRHLATPFPGQTVLEPGLFVFGYAQQEGGTVAVPEQPWMKNGSFMAFRRLKQLVPEFSNFLLTASATIGWDPVLVGARLVGRWKSGAPIALTPSQDDLSVGGNAQQNNNFDFSDDKQEKRCPFSAHIRKSNPRADLATLPATALNNRRIIRQGIPYGPEVDADETAAKATIQDRGLLFVCYQTSIVGQFEFVQGSWMNNPAFVSPGAVSMPPGAAPGVTVGIDPIMGQPIPPSTLRTPQGVLTSYPAGLQSATSPGNELNMSQLFIVPTGGGYFFMPSITALRQVLT